MKTRAKREQRKMRKAAKKAHKADWKVTRVLYRRALDGDVAAAIFWLKNR